MKIKLLAASIASASIMTSGVALADASEAVKTAIENATVTGSVYGAYRMMDQDTGANTSMDTSDWDLDEIRFGVSTTVKEDTQLNIELGYQPGDNINSSTNGVQVRDLNLVKSFGNTSVTAGRLRSINSRSAAIADEDRLFTEGAAGNTAPIVDGIEVKSFNDAGFHGSASVYKGGLDTTGGDSERNLGFGISAGWIGGDEDVSFGVTFAYTDVDGAETDTLGAPPSADAENDGYSVEAFLDMGIITASLNYFDTESESAFDTGVPATSGSSDTETDGYGLSVAIDLGGASRGFNDFGILQGPDVAKGESAYEIVASYGMSEADTTSILGGVASDSEMEIDSFGIGVNAYCGPHTKFYLEYTMSENDNGSLKLDTDRIAIGGRLNW